MSGVQGLASLANKDEGGSDINYVDAATYQTWKAKKNDYQTLLDKNNGTSKQIKTWKAHKRRYSELLRNNKPKPAK